MTQQRLAAAINTRFTTPQMSPRAQPARSSVAPRVQPSRPTGLASGYATLRQPVFRAERLRYCSRRKASVYRTSLCQRLAGGCLQHSLSNRHRSRYQGQRGLRRRLMPERVQPSICSTRTNLHTCFSLITPWNAACRRRERRAVSG